MDTLKDIQFEVWKRDAKYGGETVVCFTAKASNPSGSASATRPATDEESLRYITFYFEGPEFFKFCNEFSGTWADIAHRVDTWGDMVTFYDIDVPHEPAGTMHVRYRRLNMPLRLRRDIILQKVQAMWMDVEMGGERRRWLLDNETVQSWLREYGVGTGQVVVDADEATQKFLGEQLVIEAKTKGETDELETLSDCLKRVKQIALNTTTRADETARVSLSKEWDGFYWRALTPNGNVTMNGGIVNHGKDKPDWSIHT